MRSRTIALRLALGQTSLQLEKSPHSDLPFEGVPLAAAQFLRVTELRVGMEGRYVVVQSFNVQIHR